MQKLEHGVALDCNQEVIIELEQSLNDLIITVRSLIRVAAKLEYLAVAVEAERYEKQALPGREYQLVRVFSIQLQWADIEIFADKERLLHSQGIVGRWYDLKVPSGSACNEDLFSLKPDHLVDGDIAIESEHAHLLLG